MSYSLGDPSDRTLRRIEADVIIPNRMNAEIEKVDCNKFYLSECVSHEALIYIDLVECLRADGAVKGLHSCKPVLADFNRCKFEK